MFSVKIVNKKTSSCRIMHMIYAESSKTVGLMILLSLEVKLIDTKVPRPEHVVCFIFVLYSEPICNSFVGLNFHHYLSNP